MGILKPDPKLPICIQLVKDFPCELAEIVSSLNPSQNV